MHEHPGNSPWPEIPAQSNEDEHWALKLYVAGNDSRTVETIANLKRICEEYLQGRYDVEIIDLAAHPERAREDNILAIPTLIRRIPEPLRKLIGTLSQTEKVLMSLNIRPQDKTRA